MLSLSLLSRHAPSGSPFNLASFEWSIIPTGRTSQKGLGKNHKIGLCPSPQHQTIPPLPLTSGPWPHHVPYWLGTGWWCLGHARAFPFRYVQKSTCCSYVCRDLETRRPCFLTSYVGFSLFFCSIQELNCVWWWALHFFGPLLGFLYFLQCCTVIPAVIT